MPGPKSMRIAFLLSFLMLSSADLDGDRRGLLVLRSVVGGRSLLWNETEATPCGWVGITCELNRVIKLRLPGASLAGKLPEGVFSELTNLQTLSLRLNALEGELPSDLASCTSLRNMYLQGNALSGEIPPYFSNFSKLVRLNVADNAFTGQIPLLFNDLTRLKTLYLQDNQLSGSIPPNLSPPALEQFNVSNNNLNGSIPPKLQGFDSSAFLGTKLCGSPLGSCEVPLVVPKSAIKEKKKEHLSAGAIVGIVIGSVVGLLLLLLILVFLLRKTTKKKPKSMDVMDFKPQDLEKHIDEVDSMGIGSAAGNSGYSGAVRAKEAEMSETEGVKKLSFFGRSNKVFDLEDLLRASAEVLGKGTFGTAYKAVLEMGITVAVKRLKDVAISEKEFRERIETVGSMNHENLVPLMAYYYGRDEKLLVHNYLPMGSLSAALHGNKGAGRTALSWETRMRVMLGAARGVEYIHSQGPNTCHGNIKSSNILLSEEYEARVSDFGLVRLVGPGGGTNRAGGYRAPEVTEPRRVTQKADVYSFGVLVLEIVTGKAPSHAVLNEEGVDLPRWVQSVVRDEWTSEVFDVELLREGHVEEDMVEMLQLGVDCTAQYPDSRPGMADVAARVAEVCRGSDRS